VDWEEEMAGLNINQSWDMFKAKMEKAQDAAVPKKRRRVGNRPIWMTKNVMSN
jgi:phosphopentomutase